MTTEWLHNEKIFDKEIIEKDKFFGFVYIITNLDTGRMYVGKKLFTRATTYQKKGKKKKKRVNSDWEQYYGSSEDLLEDITKLGKKKFKREILHLCKNRSQCSYLEAREQMDRRVLESSEYYNAWIMVKIRKAHLKF